MKKARDAPVVSRAFFMACIWFDKRAAGWLPSKASVRSFIHVASGGAPVAGHVEREAPKVSGVLSTYAE
ncbi:hypothetical protein DL240_06520 [Lujinxingia litoralis]|uniref:Uncharacterized protein n=1 Tax=Lujinxingia litoralis TaxID=2211119 RepID=A0A328C7G3_9DELT|nr:hypothetical protein DL240_06520 [Lujinxingia litoralis]